MRLSAFSRYVTAREGNVVRVDFNREPEPPAPFPGAAALRMKPPPPPDSLAGTVTAA